MPKEGIGGYLYRHIALILLFLGTFSIYLFNVTKNDIGNSYYAAAAYAGSMNWKAFFFASFDPNGFISLDKPPLGIWPSAISVHMLGFSGISVMLPHVLAGTATVGLLYVIVRRYSTQKVALAAGLLALFMPVSIVVFRFNNPDSILTFMMVASLYCFLRFVGEKEYGTKWGVLTGVLLGLVFMTKGLEMAPLAVIYAFFYTRKEYNQKLKVFVKPLILPMIVMVISALLWAVAVWLTPSHSRPFIGSTQDNSIWSLLFGYNGFGRFYGAESGSAAILNHVVGFGGEPGILRMLNNDFGLNIGWLLPVAIGFALFAVIYHQTIPKKQQLLVFVSAAWLIAYALLFSFTAGTIHPYYVCVLVPPVAILVSVGVEVLWSWYCRARDLRRIVLPLLLFVTFFVGAINLSFYQTFLSQFVMVFLIGGLLIAVALIMLQRLKLWHAAYNIFVIGCCAALLSMIQYSFIAYASAHRGLYVSAAPTYQENSYIPIDKKLRDQLSHQQSEWSAAVQSSALGAALQLEARRPIMVIGGFNGTDPAVTLKDFQGMVARHKVRYFVLSGPRKKHLTSTADIIVDWARMNGNKVGDYGEGLKLYDLQHAKI